MLYSSDSKASARITLPRLLLLLLLLLKVCQDAKIVRHYIVVFRVIPVYV